jgi:NTE family protein
MQRGRSVGEDVGRLTFLTKAPLERLTSHAEVCHYPKGARIGDARQLSEAAYIILGGTCELRASSLAGAEQVVETLGPGGVFGALDPTTDGRTSAVAVSDSVLLRIERSRLELLRAEAAGATAGNDQPGPIAVTLSSDPGQPSGCRQVVMLSFLSDQIPASLICERLASSLHTETNASVVLVRLEALDPRAARATALLDGEFHLPPRVVKTAAGFHFVPVCAGRDGPSAAGVASLVSRMRSHFEYVLLEAAAWPAPWLTQFLAHSDLAYVFLGASDEDVGQLERFLREARTRDGNHGVPIKPIGCLGENKQIDGFDLRAERVASPVHLYIHGCPMRVGARARAALEGTPTAIFRADVRRLAREISGQLVGLALSSGAAKGFSHIGVLQVLEENGIEVDVVAGSSMGAYIGALWAYGLDGQEMERLARELEGRWALWSLVDPVFLPRQGFLRGLALKKRLMRSIGTARFGDLRRPLRIVAGNLATLERVVFASGEVATAVHCSAAVPGICVPITIEGETYVDGAIVDPLPVDVLREMGVTRVIAVDAIPTPDRIRYTIQAERDLARQRQARARRLFRKVQLDQPMSEFARGNLLQIVMRSLHGAQIRVAEASCLLADLVLRPNIYDDGWLDCAKPGKFITLGREVAERRLEEIKTLVAGGEVNHERELATAPMAAVA